MSASQSRQAFWMIIGYFLLIPFCLFRHWELVGSTINPDYRPVRPITRWRWAWLNTIYGNREDGVSGGEALIWTLGERHYPLADRTMVRVYYRSNLWPPLRAWLWSAWRNSTNELSR